jgi:hypothetical protein
LDTSVPATKADQVRVIVVSAGNDGDIDVATDIAAACIHQVP